MNTVSVKKGFAGFARMGYGARGAIYLIVGGLALMAAFGSGGKSTGSKGALKTIYSQPMGEVLLFALIIGLLSYCIWRFIQSIKDTDNHGTSAKGLAIRGGLLVSAITHAFLAFWAAQLLLTGSGNENSQQSGWLDQPAGQLALGAIGVAVIGAGIAHIAKGWSAKFRKYLDIPTSQQSWAIPTCRFGLIARGAVWCILGGFLVRTGWVSGGQGTSNMGDALNSLHGSPYGSWFFAIIAAGVFAFGMYSWLEAFYRRVEP